MNRRKTRANFRIHQNTKYTDTAPEVALDQLCSKMGLVLVKGVEIQVPGYLIRPDRQIANSDILIECDGIVHDTKIQRRKSSWRDDALIASGYRIIHVESELLTCHGLGDSDQFWPYVETEIKKFIDSTEASKYLRA